MVKHLKQRRSGSKTSMQRALRLPISSSGVGSAGKPLKFASVKFSTNIRRRQLATAQYLVDHKPSKAQESCAHYFLDPLSWMRPELEKGKLDGRLECPKCKTNVGKYAWQGMQCSCGDWLVPGISLAKGRLDEVKSRTSGSANMGIRMPPSPGGRRSGPGQQNL